MKTFSPEIFLESQKPEILIITLLDSGFYNTEIITILSMHRLIMKVDAIKKFL